MVLLVLLFLVFSTVGQCADGMPLLQLKQLAESGDVVAEFEYGARIENANPSGCETIITRAAESGYGPAENWAGNHYSLKVSGDGNLQKQYRRMAVRFTARAAYKNIPQSQSRLASFYASGDVLPRDSALAYAWAAIAVRVSGATESPIVTTLYQGQLEHRIANSTAQAIKEGQAFVESFRPQASGMTRVDAVLLAAQLKLTGFMGGAPILNGVLLKPGVTHKLPIDGDSIGVVCVGVGPDSAQIQFIGSNFYAIVPLGLVSGERTVVKSW
jgi:hypothetical protein